MAVDADHSRPWCRHGPSAGSCGFRQHGACLGCSAEADTEGTDQRTLAGACSNGRTSWSRPF